MKYKNRGCKIVTKICKDELRARLLRCYKPSEADAIINKATPADARSSHYENDDLIIIHSGVDCCYTVVAKSEETFPVCEGERMLPVHKENSLYKELEQLILSNGRTLSQRDIEYILNCRESVINNRDPFGLTPNAIIWMAYETLLKQQRNNK